jgi:hypothetical protein
MRTVAKVAILNVVLFYSGALNGVLDGMGRHRHRRGDIEPAATGFRQPGTGIRNNDGFTHFYLPLSWPIMPRERLSSYKIPAAATKIPRFRAPTPV